LVYALLGRGKLCYTNTICPSGLNESEWGEKGYVVRKKSDKKVTLSAHPFGEYTFIFPLPNLPGP